MISDIINEFRRKNGVGPFYNWNPVENSHCEMHCWAMARSQDAYHTFDCFLCGKHEAVGFKSWDNNFENTVAKLIFERFGNSQDHKNVLLKRNLSYGAITFNWCVYVTIRGWD